MSKYADQWDINWESSVEDINLSDYYGEGQAGELMAGWELGEFDDFDPMASPYFSEEVYKHLQLMGPFQDYLKEDLTDQYEAMTGESAQWSESHGIFGTQNMGYTDDFKEWLETQGMEVTWEDDRIWYAEGNNEMGWGSLAMDNHLWDQYGTYDFELKGVPNEGWEPRVREALQRFSDEYGMGIIDFTMVDVDPSLEMSLVDAWETDMKTRGTQLATAEETFDLTRGSIATMAEAKNIEKEGFTTGVSKAGLAGSGIAEQKLSLFEDLKGTEFEEAGLRLGGAWGDIGTLLGRFASRDLGHAEGIFRGREDAWDAYVGGLHTIGEDQATGG